MPDEKDITRLEGEAKRIIEKGKEKLESALSSLEASGDDIAKGREALAPIQSGIMAVVNKARETESPVILEAKEFLSSENSPEKFDQNYSPAQKLYLFIADRHFPTNRDLREAILRQDVQAVNSNPEFLERKKEFQEAIASIKQ